MALSESIFFSFFPKRIKSRAPQINQVLPIRKTHRIVFCIIFVWKIHIIKT